VIEVMLLTFALVCLQLALVGLVMAMTCREPVEPVLAPARAGRPVPLPPTHRITWPRLVAGAILFALTAPAAMVWLFLCLHLEAWWMPPVLAFACVALVVRTVIRHGPRREEIAWRDLPTYHG
jgi:hypothetical protein